ncbi:MAG TPA: hypothetical protein VIB39_17470 [Candidatus Angelobacter sp.]|jgi:hypothetical protein
MRKLPLCSLAFLITICGCVISPRRIVNGPIITGGGGDNSEFSLTVDTSSQVVNAGNTANYTINVQALNDFTGTVSFSASAGSTAANAGVSPTAISGGSGTVTLTVQTFATTPNGAFTISVTGTDPDDSASQTITVDLTVQGSTAASGTAVPANCVSASAGAGEQNDAVSTPPNAHGFAATFDVTPSLSGLNGVIGLSTPDGNGKQLFSDMIAFSSSGAIQARDGENLAASDQVPFAAEETYHFRLVEGLPAATYSVFVTPPGGTEIPLGVNLAIPESQRGASAVTGWGVLATGPEGASLEVCNFKIVSQ